MLYWSTQADHEATHAHTHTCIPVPYKLRRRVAEAFDYFYCRWDDSLHVVRLAVLHTRGVLDQVWQRVKVFKTSKRPSPASRIPGRPPRHQLGAPKNHPGTAGRNGMRTHEVRSWLVDMVRVPLFYAEFKGLVTYANMRKKYIHTNKYMCIYLYETMLILGTW